MPQAIGQAGFRVHATAAPKSCSVINVHLGVANHADLEAEVAERTAQVVLKGDSLGQQQLAMKAGGRLSHLSGEDRTSDERPESVETDPIADMHRLAITCGVYGI